MNALDLLASQSKRFGSLPGGEDGRNLEESVVAVEEGKEIHVVECFRCVLEETKGQP